MKVLELDIVFLSYDEPNADFNYADLCNKVPWVKRVHGVKGSDAAHKEAAKMSETDWFITVDADNIVDPKFFNYDLTIDDRIKVYSWLGKNVVNGLMYGNGGLKIWKKEFVLNMKTHEASQSDRAQVDFCWEDGYKQFMKCFSTVHINASPFQAWRAGFREGVKMTLADGIKVPAHEIKQKIWWHNLHRLKIWSTIGSHVENGLYSMLGARMGTWMTYCTDWNYIDVRDFDILRDIYETKVDHDNIDRDLKLVGEKLRYDLGFEYPDLSPDQSRYTACLYQETIDLCNTYYREK